MICKRNTKFFQKVPTFVLLVLFCIAPFDAQATVVFILSGTSWTVPTDYTMSGSSIEAIGGGGAGSAGTGGCVSTGQQGGAGGAGGMYAKITNLSLVLGDVVAVSI